MAIAYVLYNRKAGNNDAMEGVDALASRITDEIKRIDVTEISDYRVFLNGLQPEDYIVLAGGDGTLNRFANNTDGISFDNEVLYYPNGTGNDFAHDLGFEKGCEPFSVTEYLKGLPSVTVKGKTYRFINAVGYGIDGYCCEVGDELKKIPGKKVDYTAIAIKGLLFHYKPTNATVTVDGEIRTYKRVWLAPTMYGRFYGGGMMPAPEQKRKTDGLSVMLFHNVGKLKALIIFPSLFKGEHVKYTKNVEVLSGKEITVEYDRPVALQIDGETILNVTSYTASMADVAAVAK